MSEKNYLGSMIDCSRNAVMNMASVKRYIDYLAKMGYNMLMLYTEDTWEVNNQPLFGYKRGKYSKEQLKEIVAYGEEKGIELIPCIQTLGHLKTIFRWREYNNVQNCGATLLVDDENTYKLIDDMLSTVKECFKSKKVHIGMDEAYDINLGKYLTLHGMTDRFEVLKRHMKRVADMVKGYGLEPIMWSDMFFAMSTPDGEYYTYDTEIISNEVAATVPDNMELVYWDYWTPSKKRADCMLTAHKKFNKPIWFAGGALTWQGFTPHNKKAIGCFERALLSCREMDVKNVIVTCWGDDGSETSKFSVLPMLFYAAETYRGNDDLESIKAKFEEIFSFPFDDFMKIDYPIAPNIEDLELYFEPDRYMFYNDPFLGIYDDLVDESTNGWDEVYKGYAKELYELGKNEEFGYLFNSAAADCDFMSVKYNLGKRTRAAYDAKDKTALKELLPVYDEAIEKLNVFYENFRTLWYRDNTDNGFEVQDIRLGGLEKRLKNCKRTLEDYINGKIETIPQLDEPVIKRHGYEDKKEFKWGRFVTANLISHYTI